MKDMGYVTGSAEQAKELIIGTDVVYVHTDITLVEPKEGEEEASPVYRYHEVQYGKNEYIKLLAEQNAILENQVTDAQVALCEVYELLV